MPVCGECCVLSGGGLSDGPITRPEGSYRLWCVVCDEGPSQRPRPTGAVKPYRQNTVRGSTWLRSALLCMYINRTGTDEH